VAELLNKDNTVNSFVCEKLKALYLMLDKHLFRSFLHNYKEKIFFTEISEKGYATNAFLSENFSHFFL
jgi:hypothetical protein